MKLILSLAFVGLTSFGMAQFIERDNQYLEMEALECARHSERTDMAIAECYLSRGLHDPT